MKFLDEPAPAAAQRHGRWQMVLFILGAVTVLVAIVTHPDVFQVEEGEKGDVSELLEVLRPWSTIVIGTITAWALVFVALLARHRRAVAEDASARRSFRAASWTQIIIPVLPGMLIWGRLGLLTSAIGVCCLVATYVMARRVPV
jgi:hypothetical protein